MPQVTVPAAPALVQAGTPRPLGGPAAPALVQAGTPRPLGGPAAPPPV